MRRRRRAVSARRVLVVVSFFAAAWTLPWTAPPLVAQEAEGEDGAARPNTPVELVDRVAAVVGDTVVLYTEILESLLQAQAQGETLPPENSEAFDSLVVRTLNTLVDQMVLLQRAQQEDITVSEEVMEAETDRRFREVRGSFPTATAFEEAIQQSGRTLVQYRLYLRSQVRAQLMIQQFMQQQTEALPSVVVTDEEVREWFERNLAGQPQPPSITFEQVVIRPEPDDEAEAAAREQALEVLREIRDGMDFEVAARRYSQDPGNRDQGGDLGWVRRAGIDAQFAEAAWAARSGTPIGPVRTQFGYHVIKVENVRGGERKIRHILIRPELGPADVERARELAAAVADSAREGTPIERLARSHGLSDEPVRLPNVPVDRLQEGGYGEYVQYLQAPVPGEIVGPFEARTRGQRFVVLKVVEFNPRGPVELEDVQTEVRDVLTREKGIARLVEQLRDEVFVDVRL